MILQQALEHRAQVGRRLEVAVLEEIGFLTPGQSATTRPPLSAPPASRATVPVPWSVPSVPLMRAVRPNSVTSTTTVSLQAGPIFLDRGERAVERAEQLRQPSIDRRLH